jgi:hypothetical protein
MHNLGSFIASAIEQVVMRSAAETAEELPAPNLNSISPRCCAMGIQMSYPHLTVYFGTQRRCQLLDSILSRMFLVLGWTAGAASHVEDECLLVSLVSNRKSKLHCFSVSEIVWTRAGLMSAV